MNAANIAAEPTYLLLCRQETASDANAHLTQRRSHFYRQLNLNENQQEIFFLSCTPLSLPQTRSPDTSALVFFFSFLTMATGNLSK